MVAASGGGGVVGVEGVGLMKRCWDCKEYKPFDAYHRDQRRADGRNSQCKACMSSYLKERRQRRKAADSAFLEVERKAAVKYRENRKRLREERPDELIRCTWCGEEKPRRSFYSDQAHCAACEVEKQRRRLAPRRIEAAARKQATCEARLRGEGERKCNRCEETKRLSAFRVRKNGAGLPRVAQPCKACEAKATRSRYHANREQYLEQLRASRRAKQAA